MLSRIPHFLFHISGTIAAIPLNRLRGGLVLLYTVLHHDSRKVKSGARRKLRSGGSDPDLKRKCGIRLNIGLRDRPKRAPSPKAHRAEASKHPSQRTSRPHHRTPTPSALGPLALLLGLLQLHQRGVPLKHAGVSLRNPRRWYAAFLPTDAES
eukprot:1195137-Prorocentrum_minimum.AAC.3